MLQRGLLAPLRQALKYSPAVLLSGARQTGKSTLVESVTSPKRTYVTFDQDDRRLAAAANPSGFIAGLTGDVVLDEIQKVPELFSSLKLAIDRDRKPGRFLLTGSANILLLPRLSDSLAGRMEILTLGPLTQGELQGRPETALDAWFEGRFGSPPAEPRAALVERVLRGGFPVPALQRPVADRARWFDSYVTTTLARDIRDLADIERTVDLRRILTLAAARSAAPLNYAELSNACAVPQSSLKRYLALFQTLFLLHFVPAWATSAGKSLARRPKLLLADSGLAAALLGIDASRVEAAPSMFGSLLETFVGGEIFRQAAWSSIQPRLMHFRDHSGNEVDFVLEDPSGRIIGVEVKSGASGVGTGDLRGLRALEAAAKKQFLRGIVLYGGDSIVAFDANIHAVPISALWTG
ncbi:MAG: ATP-binding protein [Planctomycetes bacterium]|nr:ATP-binding protein [Planctomycetota bacterium]